MSEQKVTLNEARETINHLVQGVDPYTGETITNSAWMKHPRTIQCFALMTALLTRCIDKAERRSDSRRKKFSMTIVQAEMINFPSGDIGVKGIITAVNQAVDTDEASGLTIVSLYKVLKELGILEKSDGNGKVKTVTTAKSGMYGIKTVKYTFQGETYDRIMYTDQAKAYIRKNLPVWFGA